MSFINLRLLLASVTLVSIVSTASADCSVSDDGNDAYEVSLPSNTLVKVAGDDSALNISLGLSGSTGRVHVSCLNGTHCRISCDDGGPPFKRDTTWQRGFVTVPNDDLLLNVTTVELNNSFVYSEDIFTILRHLFKKFRLRFQLRPRSVGLGLGWRRGRVIAYGVRRPRFEYRHGHFFHFCLYTEFRLQFGCQAFLSFCLSCPVC